MNPHKTKGPEGLIDNRVPLSARAAGLVDDAQHVGYEQDH